MEEVTLKSGLVVQLSHKDEQERQINKLRIKKLKELGLVEKIVTK